MVGLDLVETLYAKVRRAGALGSLLGHHPLWERQAGWVPSLALSSRALGRTPPGAHHPAWFFPAHPRPQPPPALLRCPAHPQPDVGLLLPHFLEAPLALAQTQVPDESTQEAPAVRPPLAAGRRAEEQPRCPGAGARVTACLGPLCSQGLGPALHHQPQWEGDEGPPSFSGLETRQLGHSGRGTGKV